MGVGRVGARGGQGNTWTDWQMRRIVKRWCCVDDVAAPLRTNVRHGRSPKGEQIIVQSAFGVAKLSNDGKIDYAG